MQKIPINPNDYPSISTGDINLKAHDIFRVEDTPMFEHGKIFIDTNMLAIFTGIFVRNEETHKDYIHCVPLLFYEKEGDTITYTAAQSSFDIWIEIPSDISINHDGYFN